MENEQKMPTGMKVILVLLYLSFFGSVINFVMPLLGITSINIFSYYLGIPNYVLLGYGLVSSLFIIISIHTRKWWNISITLFCIQFLLGIISLAYLPSIMETITNTLSNLNKLNNTVMPAGINPAQLTQTAIWFSGIGVATSVIMFIYVFKHRGYFNRG